MPPKRVRSEPQNRKKWLHKNEDPVPRALISGRAASVTAALIKLTHPNFFFFNFFFLIFRNLRQKKHQQICSTSDCLYWGSSEVLQICWCLFCSFGRLQENELKKIIRLGQLDDMQTSSLKSGQFFLSQKVRNVLRRIWKLFSVFLVEHSLKFHEFSLLMV